MALIFQQIQLTSTVVSNLHVVQMFGITKDGQSVLCNVTGFRPYFYLQTNTDFDEAFFESSISRAIQKRFCENRSSVSVQLTSCRNIYGYNTLEGKMFKITVPLQSHIYAAKTALDGLGTLFETNIEFNIRFMTDKDVVGCNWIELPESKYVQTENKISKCAIEVTVDCNDFISHSIDGLWQDIAPIRVLSFDIECAGRQGIFPDASIDPVIQIACVLYACGQKDYMHKTVLTLKSCADIPGAIVKCYDTEEELLLAFKHIIDESDPDIITGYNIDNFDFPYLLRRAEALDVKSFPYLGRLEHVKSNLEQTRFESKAYGARDNFVTTMPGRMTFDMIAVIRRDYKLRSYSLNAVATHFLGEQKEDVHYSMITTLQNGDEQTRKRLAVYCLKDAILPLRLMTKLMSLINYIEMARVTGVPLSYLLSRGQQIKVVSQLLSYCKKEGFVLPVYEPQGSQEQYEGATVIEPVRGYYDVPIATLDFASLYPSIMMAHNLCYTTLITTTAQRELLAPNDVTRTPNGHFFVKSTVYKGILPRILEGLLSARKRAKNDMKNEKDPFKYDVLNGRQLALKVSANSVYGFTGATIGRLPCLEISSSVTAFGREMIFQTQTLVESKYRRPEYEADCQVIYGDTDSVMVKFNIKDMKRVMQLATEAADYVSSTFVKPIKLEFEKVYYPYLLMNKKRYAGLFWTNTSKWDKLDAKGIITVRRDNCRFAVEVIHRCLNKLLVEHANANAIPELIDYIKTTINNLLCGRVDVSKLVITKALTKTREQYAAKQAHVELAERMRTRDAGSAPVLGDRVPYVIIKGPKGSKGFETSEDPIYALENNIPIDYTYYLEHQLKKPLIGILEPVLGDDVNQLFLGDHMRTIVQTKSSGQTMLSRFVRPRESCLGCKASIDSGAVCFHCSSREGEILQWQLQQMQLYERTFHRLWSNCQSCQGSMHQEVICKNSECPVFYARVIAQKNVQQQSSIINRFNTTW